MINYSHGRILTNRMYAVPVGEQQMPAMELFLFRKAMLNVFIAFRGMQIRPWWMLRSTMISYSLWHDQRIWMMEPRKMRRADGWPPWHGGAAGHSVQPAPQACASSNISPKSHTFGSFPIEPSNIIAAKIARKQPFFCLENPDSWQRGWGSRAQCSPWGETGRPRP